MGWTPTKIPTSRVPSHSSVDPSKPSAHRQTGRRIQHRLPVDQNLLRHGNYGADIIGLPGLPPWKYCSICFWGLQINVVLSFLSNLSKWLWGYGVQNHKISLSIEQSIWEVHNFDSQILSLAIPWDSTVRMDRYGSCGSKPMESPSVHTKTSWYVQNVHPRNSGKLLVSHHISMMVKSH